MGFILGSPILGNYHIGVSYGGSPEIVYIDILKGSVRSMQERRAHELLQAERRSFSGRVRQTL